jgi:hypothetical protein
VRNVSALVGINILLSVPWPPCAGPAAALVAVCLPVTDRALHLPPPPGVRHARGWTDSTPVSPQAVARVQSRQAEESVDDADPGESQPPSVSGVGGPLCRSDAGPTTHAGNAQLAERGRALYEREPSNGVPACVGCHRGTPSALAVARLAASARRAAAHEFQDRCPRTTACARDAQHRGTPERRRYARRREIALADRGSCA